MAQQIIEGQGSPFGRLGAGIGKGFGEQLPKEVARGRLSSGLQQFEKDSANLTPIQQLSRLASIPGAVEHPQLMQSFSDLARQQMRGNALATTDTPQPSPFPKQQSFTQGDEARKYPSLTKPDVFEKAQEGYIPPTQDQIFQDAGKRYNENPALYNNDPQKAIEASEKSAARDQQIAEAYQKKHEDLSTIQDNVVKRLKDHSDKLGAKVPANVYSDVEDQAIQATKPKSEGGEGLTEQQAMKKYGNLLDAKSRDYASIQGVGNWGITGRKSSETLNSLKSLQQKFEKNNDTENFGDQLIAVNKLSPSMAYSIAQPVHAEPALNKALMSLPDKRGLRISTGQLDNSIEVAKKLAPLLGDKGSPLAVAHELEKRGYDPNVWLNYVIKNREKLNLKESQGRQLEKPNSSTGTINDWWLSAWSGVE